MSHQTNFKPRPKLLNKRAATLVVASVDREENAKVKRRSGGFCEVLVFHADDRASYICCQRAAHVHHLISGIGRRNRGVSILAAHKLHVCANCHREIHGHVLKPVNATERESAATVRYERVR